MKAWMLGLALASCQPEARPSIFVFDDADNWWVKSKHKARPMGNAMGDLSIAKLNSFRRQVDPKLVPFCYLEQVDWSSFVGVDRKTQLQIEEDIKLSTHDPFHQSLSTSDGRKFVARIGIAEECTAGVVWTIVVIQDSSNNKIEYAEWAGNAFLFLSPADNGDMIDISSCFACDVYNSLVYNPQRRKFTVDGE